MKQPGYCELFSASAAHRSWKTMDDLLRTSWLFCGEYGPACDSWWIFDWRVLCRMLKQWPEKHNTWKNSFIQNYSLSVHIEVQASLPLSRIWGIWRMRGHSLWGKIPATYSICYWSPQHRKRGRVWLNLHPLHRSNHSLDWGQIRPDFQFSDRILNPPVFAFHHALCRQIS